MTLAGTPPPTIAADQAPAAVAHDTDFPQFLASRYLHASVIASGGEALLYRATRAVDGRDCVVKLYHARGNQPDPAVEAAVARLDPSFCLRMESFFQDSRRFEEMDFVPGGSLSDLIESQAGGLDEVFLRGLLQQVSGAIANMAEHGICHRDLKPSNILLPEGEGPGSALVSDFGIASHIASLTSNASKFTSTAGTPLYAAPEAVFGEVVIEKTDIYSLGMTVFECLVGDHPFKGFDVGAINKVVQRTGMAGLVETVEDENWRRLLLGMLRVEPNERFGAADVALWLKKPDHPDLDRQPESQADGTPPIRFLGVDCRSRQALAQVMAGRWDDTFATLGQRLPEIRNWLVHDLGDLPMSESLQQISSNNAAPPQAALFAMIHALDPSRMPSYRSQVLDRENLAGLVERMRSGEEAARALAAELVRDGILQQASRLPAGDRELLLEADRRCQSVLAEYDQLREDTLKQMGPETRRAAPGNDAAGRAEIQLQAFERALSGLDIEAQRIRFSADELAPDWFRALAGRVQASWAARALASDLRQLARAESDRVRGAGLARLEAALLLAGRFGFIAFAIGTGWAFLADWVCSGGECVDTGWRTRVLSPIALTMSLSLAAAGPAGLLVLRSWGRR